MTGGRCRSLVGADGDGSSKLSTQLEYPEEFALPSGLGGWRLSNSVLGKLEYLKSHCLLHWGW